MVIIKPTLLRCIRGYRHRDYNRTVEVAEWSFSMMTGEDQAQALIKYQTKETKEQKEQRVRITSSKTQYASEKVAKFFNEVHRSDVVVDELRYQDDTDNKKLLELREALKHYAEGGNYKAFTDESYYHENFYDANCWDITEWYINEALQVCPYKLTVDARDSLDFRVTHGITEYLIIRQPVYFKLANDTTVEVQYAHADPTKAANLNQKRDTDSVPGFEMCYKYTFYGRGETQEVLIMPTKGQFFEDEWPDFERQQIIIKDKLVTVLVRELFQDLDFVPAQRPGYYRDPLTKRRTFVSPLYPATKLYDDLMKNKSEYDLTKTLHGFYQKFQYVERCKPCEGQGYMVDGKGAEVTCRRCKGKGKLSHTTVQDIVEITLPHDPTQIIDLSKMTHYAQIPEFIVTMQKGDVDEAVKDIFSVIFNETLFERSEVSVTATENKLNWRSVYNALHPYAANLVQYHKNGIYFIHRILGIKGELVNNYGITKDYNMETVNEVIDQRGKAVTAGSPNAIVSAFDLKVLEKLHQNDPGFIDQYKAIERLRPLKDKTQSEVIVITGQLPMSSKLKTQWVYFMDIIEDLKLENPNIFSLPYDVQRAAFDAMTVKYQLNNKEANEEPTPIVF